MMMMHHHHCTAFTSGGGGKRFPAAFTSCEAKNRSYAKEVTSSVTKRASLMVKLALDPDEIKKCWTLPRLYVGDGHPTLAAGSSVSLSPEQTHYLTKVMRLLKRRKQQHQPDENNHITVDRDCIRIFNGHDGEWLATLRVLEEEDISSDRNSKKRKRRQPRQGDITIVADCIHQLRVQDRANDDARPWLIFGPLKKQSRMKLLVEKCTELGVGTILPIISDRTEGSAIQSLLGSSYMKEDEVYGTKRNAKGDDMSFEKLEFQAVEAAEQCERLTIPYITKDVGLHPPEEGLDSALWKVHDIVKQWDSSWDEEKRVLLICRERSTDDASSGVKASVVPLLHALRSNNNRVAFLVGPEGGWSPDEETLFDEICSRYKEIDSPVKCVSLGTSILRAETASMLALGAWALVHDD